jgi:DNA-binding NtrC family response regulator
MQTILFVEDEESSWLLYEAEFKDEPYQIFWAKDGLVAQEVLSKEKIDLVVTDIKMPRMNGVLLIAQLLRDYPKMPVIVVSAYPHYRDWLSIDGINVKAFFVKPVTMQMLKFAVADLLKTEK